MSEVNDADFKSDTDEIIAELQAEGNEIEGKKDIPESKEDAPSQVEEPENKETEEAEPKEVVEEPTVEHEEAEPVNRVVKEPTMIPAWKAKIAEKKQAEKIAELEEAVKANQQKPTEEKLTSTNVKEMASEYGLELDESQERFFNALLQKNQVPDDMVKNVEAFQQQQQLDYLETQYDKEFTKDVLPLIKEKYGELPESQLATLRQKLHDTAFTEAYAKVPLSKIYKAEVDDLGLKHTKESVVTQKSGKTRGATIDLTNMSEDEFRNMDDDSVDEFMKAKTGTGVWNRQ